MYLSEDFRLKVGLAEMLKGGVIMDVTNVEQAKIAENAGATAVMALERVPADIRKEGGVARMASIRIIRDIMGAVSIPVMAKARIGHFTEARVLEDRYGANINRMDVPKGKADWLAYVSEFVENAKASGFVQKAIERGGTRWVTPAPAGNAN
jgi:pyridoxal 5'-phosphate synthase pdxS subunit